MDEQEINDSFPSSLSENVEMKADTVSEQNAYQSQEDGNDALSIIAVRAVPDGAYLRASNDNISAMLLRFIWQDNPL